MNKTNKFFIVLIFCMISANSIFSQTHLIVSGCGLPFFNADYGEIGTPYSDYAVPNAGNSFVLRYVGNGWQFYDHVGTLWWYYINDTNSPYPPENGWYKVQWWDGTLLGGGADPPPTISYVDVALPVELTSFTANYFDTTVVLNWETATEINNYGFEIERSLLNNTNFSLQWSTLGFVNGHGNSNSPKKYEFTDLMPFADSSVYRLKQIDTDGNYEYFSLLAEIGTINITDIEEESFPIEYELSQNYPNPFNPSTTINFQLPAKSYTTLKVYDILGKEVAVLINEEKAAGKYSISFDGSQLTSGVYFSRLTAGSYTSLIKMLMIK